MLNNQDFFNIQKFNTNIQTVEILKCFFNKDAFNLSINEYMKTNYQQLNHYFNQNNINLIYNKKRPLFYRGLYCFKVDWGSLLFLVLFVQGVLCCRKVWIGSNLSYLLQKVRFCRLD
ncbi:MAG: hypothetical protein QS2022_1990 [Candidatus Phytoplasma asteris]|nr:MAG: hypothetical protein PLY_1970 [Periwinkle leaf yellowing phytoplasma]WEX19477.1 MAG: hypothetical protein QS2022_1990 [Candidatus Phytoplasma asteris]